MVIGRCNVASPKTNRMPISIDSHGISAFSFPIEMCIGQLFWAPQFGSNVCNICRTRCKSFVNEVRPMRQPNCPKINQMHIKRKWLLLAVTFVRCQHAVMMRSNFPSDTNLIIVWRQILSARAEQLWNIAAASNILIIIIHCCVVFSWQKPDHNLIYKFVYVQLEMYSQWLNIFSLPIGSRCFRRKRYIEREWALYMYVWRNSKMKTNKSKMYNVKSKYI